MKNNILEDINHLLYEQKETLFQAMWRGGKQGAREAYDPEGIANSYRRFKKSIINFPGKVKAGIDKSVEAANDTSHWIKDNPGKALLAAGTSGGIIYGINKSLSQTDDKSKTIPKPPLDIKSKVVTDIKSKIDNNPVDIKSENHFKRNLVIGAGVTTLGIGGGAVYNRYKKNKNKKESPPRRG
jgi:hypothetical protein